jgi:acetoacetyl-CoA synthetase
MRNGIHFARKRYSRAIESESSRFLPHEVFAMPEKSARIARQKPGVAIRPLLSGQSIEKIINEGAMANPACLDWWVAFAGKFRQS